MSAVYPFILSYFAVTTFKFTTISDGRVFVKHEASFKVHVDIGQLTASWIVNPS